MSRQHYLPASYVGRFSLTRERSLRKRSVWVQRVGRPPYKASAHYVARADRLYDYENQNVDALAIDNRWAYETRLTAALDALAQPDRPLDGRIWVQVLVPFIASLFIRGIDFTRRYEARIPGITGPGDAESAWMPLESWRDNALTSGQIEWQRLLAPVMVAEWIVLHGSGAPILPTNDIAHCLTTPPNEPHRTAYAFPLDPSTMLVLERRPVRRILDWDGARWVAPISHKSMPDAELKDAVRALQHAAVRELYGPTLDSVRFPDAAFEPEVGPLGPVLLLPSPRLRSLIPYMEDYFRLLTLLERGPVDGADGSIDWSVVAQFWHGIVQVGVDFPAFPGGVAVFGNSVYLDLTRFSIEDFERTISNAELEPVSMELSDALRQLLDEEHVVASTASSTRSAPGRPTTRLGRSLRDRLLRRRST